MGKDTSWEMEVSRNKRPRYAVVDCVHAEVPGISGHGRKAPRCAHMDAMGQSDRCVSGQQWLERSRSSGRRDSLGGQEPLWSRV